MSNFTRIRNSIVFCILMQTNLSQIAPAQTHLVKDIETTPWSGAFWTKETVEMNGVIYFTGNTNLQGAELWRTDGTTDGTKMIKDILPGSESSYPQEITNVNGTLFFIAKDSEHGTELWKSDGTIEGTELVKDISSGSDGTQFMGGLDGLNGSVYFLIYKNSTTQLWRSNGTPDGTFSLMNVTSDQVTASGNYIYFAAKNGSESELWKTDGTLVGTTLVKDIIPGFNNTPQNPTDVNGVLYFSTFTWAEGEELWKSDGTSAGTVLVKDIRPGASASSPSDLFNLNGNLFFIANDGVHGRELWISNSNGTYLVKDIVVGSGSTAIQEMTNINGTLYFAADDGVHGMELWKSDGTDAGTKRVTDIATGSSNPSEMTLVDGIIYFNAYDEDHGKELWRTDGESEVTLVKDIMVGRDGSEPKRLFRKGNKLYFFAKDALHGTELWESDGVSANTKVLKDISDGTESAYLMELQNIDGTIYLPDQNYNLWKTDGTEAGSMLIGKLPFTFFTEFEGYEGGAYFVCGNYLNNLYTLYKTDGTPNSIVAISDELVSINELTVIDGILYFRGNDGVHGSELWKSDGTFNGTALLKDFRVGSEGSNPYELINLNGTLCFRSDDGVNGVELWKCEGGTAIGTSMVKDITPGLDSSNPTALTVVNDLLYFSAQDEHGTQLLWKSDGTEAGTVMVKNKADADFLAPMYLTKFNNSLYFDAWSAAHGFELWKTDGTSAGTVLVKDILAGPQSQLPENLVVVNDLLYFTAGDGIHGNELWKTDGTEVGTSIVKDITPGAAGTDITGVTSHNGHLFFVVKGQLWKSDGGPCNTRSLTNASQIEVGRNALVGSGNKLYFLGITEETGEEIFYYDFSNITVPGCTQSVTINEITPKTFGDAAFEVTGSSSAGLPVTFVSSNQSIATINGNEITIRGAGEITITAVQTGDNNYSSATDQTTLTIKKAKTNLLMSALEHTYSGFAKSASVTTTAGSLEGIQLQYKQNGNIIETATNAGTYAVEASLNNSNYEAEVVVGELNIAKSEQTISFDNLPNKLVDSGPFALSATATSKLPVSYASSDTEVATVDGDILTIKSAGSIEITASQAGNGNYKDAHSVVRSLVIGKKDQSISFPLLTDRIYGDEPFDLSAVSSSALEITYTSSDPDVAVISGNQVTIVGAGIAEITAIQKGNEIYKEATPVIRTLVVKKNTQSITFEMSTEKVIGDEAFVLSAFASSGLEVIYTSSNNMVAVVSGNQVTLIGAGTTEITALQEGNESFTEAQSVTHTLVVKKKNQSIHFDVLEERSIGDIVFDLSAVSSSGLAITYTSSDINVAVISGNQVTIIGSGSTEIIATQSGNEIYAEASAVSRMLVVRKKTQTITFNSIQEKLFGDDPFEIPASSSSGLPVTLISSDPSVAQVNGNIVSILSEGEVSITASQEGNSEYDPAAPVLRTLVIKLITGTTEQGSHEVIEIFPNPTTDYVIVKGKELNRSTVIHVSDMKGGKINVPVTASSSSAEYQIDFKNLNAGIYHLSITTNRGVVTKRIIKK